MKSLKDTVSELTGRNRILQSLLLSEVKKNEDLYQVISLIANGKSAKVPDPCDANIQIYNATKIESEPRDITFEKNLSGFDVSNSNNEIESDRYEINNDVAIPSLHSLRSPIRLTLAKLKVGESFIVSLNESDKISRIITIHFHSKTEKKFTVRKINKSEKRVWRTA